jgi:hypothetical protein
MGSPQFCGGRSRESVASHVTIIPAIVWLAKYSQARGGGGLGSRRGAPATCMADHVNERGDARVCPYRRSPRNLCRCAASWSPFPGKTSRFRAAPGASATALGDPPDQGRHREQPPPPRRLPGRPHQAPAHRPQDRQDHRQNGLGAGAFGEPAPSGQADNAAVSACSCGSSGSGGVGRGRGTWGVSSLGAGRRISRRLRPGCARGAIGRRPGAPVRRRGWRLRRRRWPGHGR